MSTIKTIGHGIKQSIVYWMDTGYLTGCRTARAGGYRDPDMISFSGRLAAGTFLWQIVCVTAVSIAELAGLLTDSVLFVAFVILGFASGICSFLYYSPARRSEVELRRRMPGLISAIAIILGSMAVFFFVIIELVKVL